MYNQKVVSNLTYRACGIRKTEIVQSCP